MKTRIMLDLETLGTQPGSVIVALGAVKFGGGRIEDRFYARVDAESCVALGLKLDAATVFWWIKQGEEARLEITKPGEHLSEVLLRFSEWVGDGDVEMWGNGASFDNVLLAVAYERAQMPRPWKYQNDRCYRTVKALHPELPAERVGVLHNALADAETQARHLMAMMEPSLGAATYRLLRCEDVIGIGDEFLRDDCEAWERVSTSNCTFVGERYEGRFLVPMRRRLLNSVAGD